jgi:Spirocyclase AveC-like
MSVTEVRPTPTSAPEAAYHREKTPPVVYWAWLGGAVIALQAYLYISWIASSDFKRVPSGPTPVPGWMKTVGVSWQILATVGAVAVLYFVVFRRWRRDGRLGTDSMLCLAFLLMEWQDPFINYSGVWFNYNSFMVNMGSWGPRMPGWLSPNSPGHMVPEPLGWGPVSYIGLLFGTTVLMSIVMGKARNRWPRIHPLQLMGGCFAIVVVIDIIVEGFIWMPLGFYSYTGGHAVTFPSRFYRFPIEEAIVLGGCWVAWASLRLFKDDKGLMLMERGVDSMKISPRRKTLLRFLAIVGAINLVYIVIFMIPAQWVGMHPTQVPADVQKRSYLTNLVCGDGTTYACQGPAIPNVHGNHALHISPNGQLVVPPGVKLPHVVPLQR